MEVISWYNCPTRLYRVSGKYLTVLDVIGDPKGVKRCLMAILCQNRNLKPIRQITHALQHTNAANALHLITPNYPFRATLVTLFVASLDAFFTKSTPLARRSGRAFVACLAALLLLSGDMSHPIYQASELAAADADETRDSPVWDGCQGKHPYSWRKANELAGRGGWRAYRCPVCGRSHVGDKPQSEARP